MRGARQEEGGGISGAPERLLRVADPAGAGGAQQGQHGPPCRRCRFLLPVSADKVRRRLDQREVPGEAARVRDRNGPQAAKARRQAQEQIRGGEVIIRCQSRPGVPQRPSETAPESAAGRILPPYLDCGETETTTATLGSPSRASSSSTLWCSRRTVSAEVIQPEQARQSCRETLTLQLCAEPDCARQLGHPSAQIWFLDYSSCAQSRNSSKARS